MIEKLKKKWPNIVELTEKLNALIEEHVKLEEIVMTGHDRAVLQITRSFLRKGEKEITIGSKVVSHHKIVAKLRKEFPKATIKVGR